MKPSRSWRFHAACCVSSTCSTAELLSLEAVPGAGSNATARAASSAKVSRVERICFLLIISFGETLLCNVSLPAPARRSKLRLYACFLHHQLMRFFRGRGCVRGIQLLNDYMW